jgi:hypothetical protein
VLSWGPAPRTSRCCCKLPVPWDRPPEGTLRLAPPGNLPSFIAIACRPARLGPSPLSDPCAPDLRRHGFAASRAYPRTRRLNHKPNRPPRPPGSRWRRSPGGAGPLSTGPGPAYLQRSRGWWVLAAKSDPATHETSHQVTEHCRWASVDLGWKRVRCAWLRRIPIVIMWL